MVVKRKRGRDGELLGRFCANPVLDTSVYEVKFDNGSMELHSTNNIDEHIYKQMEKATLSAC